MKRVLIRAGFKPLVFLLCLLCSVQLAGATTVTIPADDDMIVGARAIVRGRVLSVGSALDQNQDRIYTYITLRVQEVLKGQIKERRIVIKELGGIVGNRAMVIYGNPQFRVGERVLLYLDTWADGSLRTYQMFLGKFNIITDQNTGQQIALRSSPDANTLVLPRHLHSTHASPTSTERMELRAYTRLVRKRLAANLERSVGFDIEYYRNIPVLAQPPEYSAELSRGEIQPHFTFMTPAARWHEPDSAQPITYTINPNPAPPDSGIPALTVDAADVAAAANVWSTVSGSALRLVSSGTLNDCYTITGTLGINVVSNNCDGRNAPSPGCASILAWGGWSGGMFSPTTVNGMTFNHRITQGFVSCNPWAACGFSDHCSVQYIITHELGHALGIGHSQFTAATMFGSAVSIARCAGLHTDDMDAVRFAYPGSSGGGGTPLSIVTTSLPGATTGSAYSQTLVASGGTTPYSWNIVSGFGTLPPGLTLASGGTISGTPSTAGTFNFRVQ
ncbi:MAG TPA: matrixin family metalloprotease, partial [Blastocatellia bacterium]|nr:matrixin family metalloprotease [Blastocatellia bacterium]